jgi:hypothetical protein
MEKGKIYRVKEDAMSSSWEWSEQNKVLVECHGYLWLWKGDRDDDNYLLCSLATGELHLWYHAELEAADAGEG